MIENLKAIAEIQIPDLKTRITKIETLISQFELEGVTNVPAKLLSGGQKKKLVIAISLLNNPKNIAS